MLPNKILAVGRSAVLVVASPCLRQCWACCWCCWGPIPETSGQSLHCWKHANEHHHGFAEFWSLCNIANIGIDGGAIAVSEGTQNCQLGWRDCQHDVSHSNGFVVRHRELPAQAGVQHSHQLATQSEQRTSRQSRKRAVLKGHELSWII